MFFKTLVLFSVLASVHYSNAVTDKIICYDATWAIYRPDQGSFKPEFINPTLCTHVYYAFFGVNPDGTLDMIDSWNAIDLGTISKIEALKSANPHFKVILSIGGANAGNILTGIAASSKLRANFISNCIQFLIRWNYDGIDLAWEYPSQGDKHNYVTLLQEMKDIFQENDFILSVVVPATPTAAYDVPEISQSVDLINLLSYDFHVSTAGTTGLNSPLYGPLSVDASVASWVKAGADPSKLTVGVPFYGHSFSLIDINNHGVGAPASPGIGGPYTKNQGVSDSHFQICEFYDDWQRVWDDVAQVPYRYDGTNWVSYDDEESVGLKAKYAQENGLAGVNIWSLDTDDFLGSCGSQYPLTQSIKNIFSK